jgi:succinyl-CoA synthetase beta subunit
MNLHEYQAKELLQQFGVAVPGGIKATSQQEAIEAAKQVREKGPWVVKAQVHAGGRGKAGGVKFVRTIQDVEEVPVAAGFDPAHPPDRSRRRADSRPADSGRRGHRQGILSELSGGSQQEAHHFIGSSEGGMDIEEVAAKTPEKILTLTIDPIAGVQPYQAANSASRWAWSKKKVDQLVKVHERRLQPVRPERLQHGRDQPADREPTAK